MRNLTERLVGALKAPRPALSWGFQIQNLPIMSFAVVVEVSGPHESLGSW